MKDKELKLFAVLFIALLVLYVVTKPRHHTVNIDQLVQTVLVGVSKEDVASIEVYKLLQGDQRAQMLFQKDEKGQWRIPTWYNAKVQKSRIERLLDDLIEMTGKVRSNDVRHHETYQITDEKGIHLLLKDEAGKTLANLVIGKRAEEDEGGFVRFADREKVYFTDKNLLSSLAIYTDIDTLTRFKPRSFLDLKAIDEDKDKIQEIAVASEAGYRHLVKKEREVASNDTAKTKKKESYWVLIKGGREIEMDAKEMDSFLRDVTSVYASEVVDRIGNTLADINKPAQYGINLNMPRAFLIFKTKDGTQKNYLFGKEYDKDKGSYLYTQEDGLVYEISKYNRDKILKWVEELPKKTKSKA